MSFGGKQETKDSIPKWLQQASQDAVRRGSDVSDIGYVPYMGPEIAAFQDAQLAAMRNNQAMAADLGLDAGPAYTPPTPTDFGNGMVGYSSYDPFMAELERFKAARPGQFDYINSMFIDPVTGEPGSRSMSAVQQERQQQAMAGQPVYGGDGGRMAGRVMQEQAAQRAGVQPGGGGGLGLSDLSIGGWNVSDLWDGGGLGASGGPHKGAGLLSTAANIGKAISKGSKT